MAGPGSSPYEADFAALPPFCLQNYTLPHLKDTIYFICTLMIISVARCLGWFLRAQIDPI